MAERALSEKIPGASSGQSRNPGRACCYQSWVFKSEQMLYLSPARVPEGFLKAIASIYLGLNH